MKLTYSDIRGVFGILPTPATADASHWSTQNSIDFAQVEKLVGLMGEAGIDLIATTGTFGECATLTRDELVSLVECVVQTNGYRCPVFAGVTTLNTRDTIALGRQLVDVGADGLFVGRPMWLAMDDDAIVRYYEDIASAIPGVPLVVYDNPVAFKGKISTVAYQRLARIPEVVASKHTGGPQLLEDMRAVGDCIRILPLATSWLEAARTFPDRAAAAWAGSVACAPKFNMVLAQAILAQDWGRAQDLSDKANWAEAAMFANGDLAAFMDYSIQIGHLRFQSAGLIDPGPPRPPYLFLPDVYREGAIECGQRWKVLENPVAA